MEGKGYRPKMAVFWCAMSQAPLITVVETSIITRQVCHYMEWSCSATDVCICNNRTSRKRRRENCKEPLYEIFILKAGIYNQPSVKTGKFDLMLT
jgi:hypothetical protein